MGSIEELEEALPWGLHDAYLEGLRVEYAASRLDLTVRLMMSARQDLDQRAHIRVEGLVFCAVDPPEQHLVSELADEAVWIDAGSGVAAGAEGRIPPAPLGCFLHWLYVHEWNAFIHICGKEAALTWLEPEPVAARGKTRALYPGDEVPDPK